MRTRFAVAWVLSSILLLPTARLWAQTVTFSENFQSYAPGSNLIGQNGWAGWNDVTFPVVGPSTIIINAGTGLPGSQVMDGRDLSGGNQQQLGEHSFTINPSLITTFTWDAFAPTVVHNQFVGLHPFGAHSPSDDAMNWTVTTDNTGVHWLFAGGAGAGNFDTSGGINTPVRFGIVLDGISHEQYGLYDFTPGGGAWQETTHFPITAARIASMNAVDLFIDHRNPDRAGIEADNFSITETPEPAAAWMILAATVGLIASRRSSGRSSSRIWSALSNSSLQDGHDNH